VSCPGEIEMSGKLCTGAPENNIGAGRLSQSKAFCEGRKANNDGDLIGTNPHVVDSPDSDAWLLGYVDATAASATCCAE